MFDNIPIDSVVHLLQWVVGILGAAVLGLLGVVAYLFRRLLARDEAHRVEVRSLLEDQIQHERSIGED